jgi:tetratricopeptide (TPR) repeat protein/cellulose biosynthesis protein BcsQ
MALANLAVLLARAGKRVLCIDWDLEGPGLDRYFRAVPRSKPDYIPNLSQPKNVGGLLAILERSTKDELVPWSDFVQTRTGPDGIKLDFLGSGEADPEYAAKLGRFSWIAFFEKRRGGDIIEALRYDWKTKYDFILIDSRTGLTDTSGICTIQMPDLVVLFFAANQQNIQWCERVAHGIRKGRRALPYDRKFLTIIPVLSRFDAHEESDRAAEAIDRIAKVFEPFFSDWLPRSVTARDMLASSALPYMPRYSFDEALAVEDEPAIGTQGLSFNYHLLARLILARLQGVRSILAGVGVPGAALPPLLPSITDLRAELRNNPHDAQHYTQAFKARALEEPLEAAEAFETLAAAWSEVLSPTDAVQFLQEAKEILSDPAVGKGEEIPRLQRKQADLLARAGRTAHAREALRLFLENKKNRVETANQLPPPPEAFTGRGQELRDLETALTQQGNIGAAISASGAGIQGMGGVGKTALAAVLAHRLKDKYPDAQICLNLRGFDPMGRIPMPPAEAMQSIIHAFQPEAKLPETAEELTPIYNSVLNDAGRVLLFLDNAANADQIRPLLPPPNCLLLITSRNQFSLPGLATRNIDCLPPAESQKLLLNLAPRIQGHETAAAKLCGHLPLALEVFAGAINNKSLTSVPELLERLRTRQEKLDAVEAAFQVSYELLGEELQKHWRLLAVFFASFDLRAAAAVWDEGLGRDALPRVQAEQEVGSTDSLNSARNAMQMLVNASLVERNETTQRFHLHDLVRQFCNGKLSDAERDAAMMRYAGHYRKVGNEAQQLYLKGGDNVLRGLELFDRERIHIEAAFEWLALRRDESSAALLVSLVDAVVLTGQALRFHPRQRIRWLQGQREAARITKNRQAEGNALGNLGNAYMNLGEPRKAIEFYEQALVIECEIRNRRGEGTALGNLGIAYANLGKARKAIEFYEQQLVITLEIGDRRGEGNALGNLGNAYADLGEQRKAIEFYEQALVIEREIGDRRGEGTALGNLGIAYADLDEPRKAIEFYEQQLVITREIGDRRGEGNALGNLGIAYTELSEPRKGIEFLEQQLAMTREIGDRRGEGNSLGNLGNTYRKLGEPRKAIEFYEQALVIDREIGDRRGEGNSLGNLGNAYYDLGESRKGIEFYEQQLVITREIGNRSGEGNALFNSALALDELNDRTQAIARAEAALQIYEAIEDPHAAQVRAKLEEWKGDRGK